MTTNTNIALEWEKLVWTRCGFDVTFRRHPNGGTSAVCECGIVERDGLDEIDNWLPLEIGDIQRDLSTGELLMHPWTFEPVS